MTQEEANQAFEEIKKAWDKVVKESGQTEQMFIALDKTGKAANFLHRYWQATFAVAEEGLEMSELVKGLKVSYS